MLTLISCDHVDNAPNAIEVELTTSKSRKIAVDVVPKRLIAKLKTEVGVSLAPKTLVDLNVLAICVIHQFQNIIIIIYIVTIAKLGEQRHCKGLFFSFDINSICMHWNSTDFLFLQIGLRTNFHTLCIEQPLLSFRPEKL